MYRLWVYNAEFFLVASGHPFAPVIRPPKRNSKQVFFWDTLVYNAMQLMKSTLFSLIELFCRRIEIEQYYFQSKEFEIKINLNRQSVCEDFQDKATSMFL